MQATSSEPDPHASSELRNVHFAGVTLVLGCVLSRSREGSRRQHLSVHIVAEPPSFPHISFHRYTRMWCSQFPVPSQRRSGQPIPVRSGAAEQSGKFSLQPDPYLRDTSNVPSTKIGLISTFGMLPFEQSQDLPVRNTQGTKIIDPIHCKEETLVRQRNVLTESFGR